MASKVHIVVVRIRGSVAREGEGVVHVAMGGEGMVHVAMEVKGVVPSRCYRVIQKDCHL